MTFAQRTGTFVIAALVFLTGCASTDPSTQISPPPGTTSPPAGTVDEELPTIDPQDFDLVVTRELKDGPGLITCTGYLRAEPASPSGDPANADAASQFLAAYDASGIEVSLEDYEAEDLRRRREQGVSEAQLLFMLVLDQINQDFSDAGLLVTDVSLESETRCE